MPDARTRETQIMRMHTRILIDRFPSDIVVERPRRAVPDGQGGVERPSGRGQTLRPQRVFLSGLNSNGRSLTAARWDVLPEGERFLVRYVVIGPYDADLQEDDEFTFQGRRFRIMSVFPDRAFETKCEAVTVDG